MIPIARRHYIANKTRLTYDFGRFAESEYFQDIRGKRIAIVGSAGYLQGLGKGEEIDSYDYVVSINHALPITFPQDYGSRVDILYHILSHRAMQGKTLVSEEEIIGWKNSIKWLVSRHDVHSERIKALQESLQYGPPWVCIRDTVFRQVRQAVRKSPNTGLVAIAHLLKSQLKELAVYGFDFYFSGVYEGYGDVKENETALEVNERYHDVESQIKYVDRLRKRDTRLKLDERLISIIQEVL